MSGPFIHTPLTRITDHWLTLQWTPCAPMELDFFRCGARVGAINAQTMCKKELEDYRECVTKEKQIQRYILVQAERRKQKKKFIDPPERDSYGVE